MCVRIYLCVCVRIYLCVCTYIYMCASIYIYMYVYVCVYVYIFLYIYVYNRRPTVRRLMCVAALTRHSKLSTSKTAAFWITRFESFCDHITYTRKHTHIHAHIHTHMHTLTHLLHTRADTHMRVIHRYAYIHTQYIYGCQPICTCTHMYVLCM